MHNGDNNRLDIGCQLVGNASLILTGKWVKSYYNSQPGHRPQLPAVSHGSVSLPVYRPVRAVAVQLFTVEVSRSRQQGKNGFVE
jgi:hypothetical protein